MTLDGFRPEFFVETLGGDDATDLVGRRIRGWLERDGVLVIWPEEADHQETGCCPECQDCLCREAASALTVCEICNRGSCRELGIHGNGAWARAMSRGFVLENVTTGGFADVITMNGLQVEMYPRGLDIDFEHLVGEVVTGFMAEDCQVYYTKYIPPSPEVSTNFLTRLEEQNET